MGLFDLFARREACPKCGESGAKVLLGMAKCRNRLCAHFDPGELGEAAGIDSIVSGPAPRERSSSRTMAGRDFAGSFNPQGADRVEFRYRNFRGEEKTYVGDRRSVRLRGAHVSLRLAPTGQRAAFLKSRVLDRVDWPL